MAKLKAQIGSVTGLHAVVLTQAAGWYAEVPAPFRKADPLVLKKARQLSKGNWHRCIVEGDGSIIVCKNVVWDK
jgi:hypothetical protein